MPHTLSRYKVKDYAQWKRGFDEREAIRKDSGVQGKRVWRNTADPNEVVILLEWESLEHARQYIQSDDLRAALPRVGIVDQPDVYYLEDAR